MIKLDDAITRLEGAVDNVENAFVAALARGGDTEALIAELEAAKRDYAALAATTDEVSEKLDTTISRLKFVLEN
ncbi:MAG: hypothetical protein CMM47_05905 [Rhodospirillaceae bacterium]|nr:hypothetical protein [Rhodospirillaceae bacterium]|tara:strand:+ start:375 stop:596 length:222 start_codon:yes stop_codon:yes gene_type:complete